MPVTVLPAAVHRLARDQGGLVSFQQLRDAGVGRHRLQTLIRREALRSVVRNVYELALGEPVPGGSDQRFDRVRVRAAWLGLLSAPGSTATGLAALVLHGIWGVPANFTPEVTLIGRSNSRGAPGVRIRQFAHPFEVAVHQGRCIAAPVPALVQALPGLGFDGGIVVIESALNRGVIRSEDTELIREGLRGKRGVANLGQWWRYVDGRAESPSETRARLGCLRAGLPAPHLQVPIRSAAGEVIARGDMGWPLGAGRWLLVEIDGRDYHSTPEALFRDRDRSNRILIEGGHLTLRFTGRDVMRGAVPGAVARVLREQRDG